MGEAAQTVIREVEKTFLGNAFKNAFTFVRNKLSSKRKLLIIGGGEIATEIALVALRTEHWNIKAIVDRDPLQGDKETSEIPKVPISNLLYYLGQPKIGNVYTTIEKSEPYAKFQFISGNLHDLDYVTKFIVKEKPDVVLLEDVFLSSDEWIALNLAVSKELEGRKTIFLPSPEQVCPPGAIRQSDIFLKRSSMKDFLIKNMASENLIGVLGNEKPALVDLEMLKIELDDLESGKKTPDLTTQYALLEEEFKKHGKIVLKPDSTSSGHGQFMLSSRAQLDPSVLSKQITESLVFVEKHRIRNKIWIIEKYLRNKTETCVVVSRVLGQKRVLLNDIYYTKYDMETYDTGRFKNLTRLESSETKFGDSHLLTRLAEIACKIFDCVSSPFLYVEFLLDNDHKDKYGKPRAFINEISYRPDDAGFITQVSHQNDQFDLFVKSLDAILAEGGASKIEQAPVVIKPTDTYLCRTLNPENPIKFDKNALFFDFPSRISKNLIKLRLYEKYLGGIDQNVDYGRTVGFLWHHSSESDEQVWEVLSALRSAFDEKGLNLLKKSLEMSSAQARNKHGSTARRTVVVSDWEGPWVKADHAYEVVRAGIPDGGRLFSAISEYDDYLSYIRKKEGYEPGDTLALIAPFLIAYDISEKFLSEIAAANANFLTGAIQGIASFQEFGYPFRIVSTSYCHYVNHTTSLACISRDDVRCTDFPLDKYRSQVNEKDKQLVRDRVPEIINLGKLGINAYSKETDLPADGRKIIAKMDDLFWKFLPSTSFGHVLERVRPLGGHRKLDALLQMLQEENRSLDSAAVVGDSITDWVMLKRTRDAGGLSIAFNGNDYAIRNANVAIISDNCMVTPVLIDLFENVGMGGIKRIVENWSPNILQYEANARHLNPTLFERFSRLNTQTRKQDVYWITDQNLDFVIELSRKFRKTVRGSAVGSLG